MNHSRLLLLLAQLLLPGMAAAAAIDGTAPYPASAVLTGFKLDSATVRVGGDAAGGWALTRDAQGKLYAGWSDGAGLGQGLARDAVGIGARTAAGIALLDRLGLDGPGGHDLVGGGPPAPCMPALGGPLEPIRPDRTRFPCGGLGYGGALRAMLAFDGSLAVVAADTAADGGYGPSHLYRWLPATNVWSRMAEALTLPGVGGLLAPSLLQAGRGYHDGSAFLYAYAVRQAPTGTGRPALQQGPHGGEILLLRAPRASALQARSAWDYLAGLDGAGQPRWTRDLAAATPVITDAAGVGEEASATFVTGLGRHLVLTQHGEAAASLLTLLEAPAPWGPWHTVAYTTLADAGLPERHAFRMAFLPGSFSADGLRFTLALTGTDLSALVLVDGELTPAAAAAATSTRSRASGTVLTMAGGSSGAATPAVGASATAAAPASGGGAGAQGGAGAADGVQGFADTTALPATVDCPPAGAASAAPAVAAVPGPDQASAAGAAGAAEAPAQAPVTAAAGMPADRADPGPAAPTDPSGARPPAADRSTATGEVPPAGAAAAARDCAGAGPGAAAVAATVQPQGTAAGGVPAAPEVPPPAPARPAPAPVTPAAAAPAPVPAARP